MKFAEAMSLAIAEMADELSPTTMPTWRSHARAHLRYWGEDRNLTTLTRLEVQAWVNWRAKTGVKPSTVGHEFCLLKRLWRVLEDRGLDSGLQFPMARVRLPKKRTDKRKIKPEVVDELQDLLKPEDWDLVNFTQLTMLRRLEVFRLQPSHILEELDENNQPRYKVRIVISKTGRARTVPLNEEAARIALRRIAVCKSQNRTYLFGNDRPNRYAAACYWSARVWRPFIKSIGKGGEFHGLRHRGAHAAWLAKAKIETISKMLGHSTIAQTEHYIGVTEESMWEAANAVAVLAKSKPAETETEPALQPPPNPPEPALAAKRRDSAWLGF